MTCTLTGPGDLVAVVPFLLGYHPGDSLVVASVRGVRLTRLERVDLGAASAWARAVDPDPEEVVYLLAYADAPGVAARTLRRVVAVLEGDGVAVGTTAVVTPAGWRHLGERRVRPLPRPEDVPAVLPLVCEGRAPAPDRAAYVDRLRPAARRRPVAAGPVPSPQAAIEAWRAVVTAHAARPGAAPAREARDVAVRAAAHPGVRDAVLAWLCPDFLPDPPVRAEPLPLGGAALVDAAVAVARDVPDEERTHVLAMAGALAWWWGDGTLAGECADTALALPTPPTLAGLVADLVRTGARPPRPDGADLCA